MERFSSSSSYILSLPVAFIGVKTTKGKRADLSFSIPLLHHAIHFILNLIPNNSLSTWSIPHDP